MDSITSAKMPLPEDTELVVRPIVYADLMELLKAAEREARAMKSRQGDELASTINKAIGTASLFEIDTPSRRARKIYHPPAPAAEEKDPTDLGLSPEEDLGGLTMEELIDGARARRAQERRAIREIERAGLA
jgi:hypothetical protein